MTRELLEFAVSLLCACGGIVAVRSLHDTFKRFIGKE